MTGTSLGSRPRHTHHASPVHEPPAAIRATGIIVVLTVVLAILAIAFALPAARSKPHDIPVGAAGPMAAGSGLGTPLLGRGVAERLGHPRPVVAAGRNRYVAAVHRLLRRCRRDDRDRSVDLLGGCRHGTDRDRRCSPG